MGDDIGRALQFLHSNVEIAVCSVPFLQHLVGQSQAADDGLYGVIDLVRQGGAQATGQGQLLAAGECFLDAFLLSDVLQDRHSQPGVTFTRPFDT